MGATHGDAHSNARKEAFLAAFRLTANVTAAASAASVGRRTVYQWLEDDPDFRPAMEDAEEEAVERLEREARRRAEEGVVDYVVSQGRLVYIEDPDTGERKPLVKRVYSDSLMLALLKAHRPDRYKDRAAHEITGKGGGPVEVEVVFDLELGDGEEESAGT